MKYPAPFSLDDPRVMIRPPVLDDFERFRQSMEDSRALHHPWIQAPLEELAFRRYLKRIKGSTETGFLIIRQADNAIAGVINLSVITYAALCSAYMGYYATRQLAGRGYIKEGMMLVINHAFEHMGLHRLEANIQPGNTDSLGLVQSLGFEREGFSPAYLKINDAWCDHERWAIRAEQDH